MTSSVKVEIRNDTVDVEPQYKTTQHHASWKQITESGY